MIEILYYTGTILIIVGALLITSKKASNPRVRAIALISYLLANCFWIPLSIMLGQHGMLLFQIVLFIINIKELKNKSREMRGLK